MSQISGPGIHGGPGASPSARLLVNAVRLGGLQSGPSTQRTLGPRDMALRIPRPGPPAQRRSPRTSKQPRPAAALLSGGRRGPCPPRPSPTRTRSPGTRAQAQPGVRAPCPSLHRGCKLRIRDSWSPGAQATERQEGGGARAAVTPPFLGWLGAAVLLPEPPPCQGGWRTWGPAAALAAAMTTSADSASSSRRRELG